MNYIKVSQAAEKWGLSTRRVRLMCAEGKIEGAIQKGKLYYIPETALKPIDSRRAKNGLINEIDRKKEVIANKRPLTEGEVERLRSEFMVEFTYNSNAIEGNTLTLKETAMALEGMTVDQKPLKDHLDAVGHRDAFLYVQDIATGDLPLSETIIKNIHSLVLMNRPDDRGVFRRIPVRIMGAYTEPVEPHLIVEKMEELLTNNENRKGTMHDIERIARFHLEFEGIHPFIDGNGRTGRLIMNLDLIRCGFPPINIKFTDRKKYYDAFDAYYRDNDVNKMINLIATYVNERMEEYLRILS